jgi:cell wall-associated NlpC family hydrolase
MTVAMAAVVLAGCFQQTGTRSADIGTNDPQRSRIVFTALQMVGVPYRYGGSTPAGFDCSGLVQYAYRSAGIRVPRTAVEQFRASLPVDLDEAAAGDLLFFRNSGSSHVGIYVGDNRFVHAPSTGRDVQITSLSDPYYKRTLLRAGRITAM